MRMGARDQERLGSNPPLSGAVLNVEAAASAKRRVSDAPQISYSVYSGVCWVILAPTA